MSFLVSLRHLGVLGNFPRVLGANSINRTKTRNKYEFFECAKKLVVSIIGAPQNGRQFGDYVSPAS